MLYIQIQKPLTLGVKRQRLANKIQKYLSIQWYNKWENALK